MRATLGMVSGPFKHLNSFLLSMLTPVKTPCVGICSTGIGDAVCRGCKRFSHEVIDWNAYSEAQRRIIENRLAGFMAQVVARYVVVEDVNALQNQLELQRVRYRQDREPLCWVFDLLRAGSKSIREPAHFGLRLLTRSPLPQIKADIDADYYALSVAYYEAYILPGLTKDKADPASQGC
ncbi:DUF1289 domain-containing protein [Simiduia agarivorans]|uniref:Fe-S protein n=1 Tax=Simiduia agarivorans (strain DSM 21679 / JCM 13881 / BCRC 17597 / SA1) TaxID=1117647 RepID=K4KTN0_SIMAS|nr:DUF1289 domain-containing protein [Simiduia agarivorans]AFU97327.2 hypothetical protein M5M_00447 [Simiduia agarivorans SA1 = DSM 21679]